MKCIKCGTDNNLKDRTRNQGRCIKCQHQFVFEPTSMGTIRITDPFFAKAIADISANNTLFFTPKQLFYILNNRVNVYSTVGWKWLFNYCFFNIWATGFFGVFSSIFVGSWLLPLIELPRETTFIVVNICVQIWFIYRIYTQSSKVNHNQRMQNAKVLCLIGFIMLMGGIYTSVVILNSFAVFTIYVLLGMLSIYLGLKRLNQSLVPQEFLFSQSQFQEWFFHWEQINGSIVKMLPFPRQQIAPVTINPDVTAYSFDRLVVCDSAAIAQLLIANNFHFENNCAILSVTGYPESIFDTTMQMLRRNPELKVYSFHDCSPQGVGLVHHLGTSPNWFQDSNVAIIDLGLLPRQIMAAKRGMFIQSSDNSAQRAKELPGKVRQSLLAEELTWLEAGNFVELESFSPQKLMRILHRGMVNGQSLNNGESNLLLVDDSGNSNSMYILQTFG
ncbi:hypothetical protein VB620_06725 [Nodularia harveyana UHCC-0300]|uniref:Topoisomerase 6 subunit A/Spo11 TOPRIM domain-containing protein n=1 Tax=Nodularia harveyana UHCC-0300 TaxID=2974287 RepID=A0ABU5UBY2_9CYAN|nr:hypothetical protein [Nodularia harveyana]MEA5581032.1 hypothetical protein [Nodularia harveyana UHCC-0300]